MTVLWISAYTLSLCNTLFVLYVWTLRKNSAVFALFLLVFNVFLTTAVPFISIMLNVFSLPAQFLLYLLIACFSLSVPNFIFSSLSANNQKRVIPRWYVSACIVLTAVFCVLFALDHIRQALLIVFLLPLFSIFSMIGVKIPHEKQDFEQKRLAKTGIRLFITASSLFAVYGILQLIPSVKNTISLYFFGMFPIAYQIPVFMYNTASVSISIKEKEALLQKLQHSSVDNEVNAHNRTATLSPACLCDRLLLSRREAETAVKLYEGKTYSQIADELFVSLSAVKKHAYNIYRKLEITNNRQLMQKINDIL